MSIISCPSSPWCLPVRSFHISPTGISLDENGTKMFAGEQTVLKRPAVTASSGQVHLKDWKTHSKLAVDIYRTLKTNRLISPSRRDGRYQTQRNKDTQESYLMLQATLSLCPNRQARLAAFMLAGLNYVNFHFLLLFPGQDLSLFWWFIGCFL